MSLTIEYPAIVQRQQEEHNIQRRSGALFHLLNYNYTLVRPHSSSGTKDNLKYYYVNEIEYAIKKPCDFQW
jgi:hypothetical protein